MPRANRRAIGPPSPARGVHDPEFDAPRVVRHGAPNRDRPPHDYQRLVANPFLAFFGFVVWFGAFVHGPLTERLGLNMLVISSVVLVLFLFQYHCLDCGATGHLGSWREHNCLGVQGRMLAGTPHWFRGSTPDTQTVTWVIVVALAVIGYRIAL